MEGYESYPSDSCAYLEMEIRTRSLADGALTELSRKKTLEEVLEIPGIRDELEEVLLFKASQSGGTAETAAIAYQELSEEQKNELLKVYLSKMIVERHDSLNGKKSTERLWLISTTNTSGEVMHEWRTGQSALDVLNPGESVFVGYEGFYWADVYDSLEQIRAD